MTGKKKRTVCTACDDKGEEKQVGVAFRKICLPVSVETVLTGVEKCVEIIVA